MNLIGLIVAVIIGYAIVKSSAHADKRKEEALHPERWVIVGEASVGAWFFAILIIAILVYVSIPH